MNHFQRFLIFLIALFGLVSFVFSQEESPNGYKLVSRSFYDKAGRWYVGAANLGYNYSFKQDAHVFSLGFVGFRYKMFAASLLDAEFAFPKSAVEKYGKDVPCEFDENYGNLYDDADKIALWSTFVWKPSVAVVIPANKDIAVTLYSGAAVNLIQFFPDYRDMPDDWKAYYKNRIPSFSLLGGVSLLLNFVPVMPMNIFAEYRYPFDADFKPFDIKGDKHKYFRVGISFSFGAHL